MRHLVSVLPDFRARLNESSVINTPSSIVAEVDVEGRSLILKCSFEQEERSGLRAQSAWGYPMARIMQFNEYPELDMTAALMERGDACSHPGIDDTARMCALVRELHSSPRQPNPVALRPLTNWFLSLTGYSGKTSGLGTALDATTLPEWALTVLDAGAHQARDLLSAPHPELSPVALHGDVHHGNILPCARSQRDIPHLGPSVQEENEWKFIDPKGLYGEPLFDYCNLLYNPDLTQAADTALFAGRAGIVGKHLAEVYQLDLYHRYLRWVLAYGALSALWHLEDGNHTAALSTLRVARLAHDALPH